MNCGFSVFLNSTITQRYCYSLHKKQNIPTASRVRVLAADSAPPALASGSGSDSELCDAIGDSGDIAADGAATDDAEEEPSPVNLDSILGNQTSSGKVAADKDGEEADDEEDYLEGDKESVVDSGDEPEDTGVEEGEGEDRLQDGDVGASFNPCSFDFSS